MSIQIFCLFFDFFDIELHDVFVYIGDYDCKPLVQIYQCIPFDSQPQQICMYQHEMISKTYSLVKKASNYIAASREQFYLCRKIKCYMCIKNMQKKRLKVYTPNYLWEGDGFVMVEWGGDGYTNYSFILYTFMLL